MVLERESLSMPKYWKGVVVLEDVEDKGEKAEGPSQLEDDASKAASADFVNGDVDVGAEGTGVEAVETCDSG